MKKQKLRYAIMMVVLVITGYSLTACAYDDVATPTSMCAFVVNDGKEGRDAKIDHIAYPGDVIDTKDGKKVPKYFPCNGRNFLVNDGKDQNANGDKVGDDHTPTVAYTKDGTKVLVSWKAFWTPNQAEPILTRSFYPFCYKYNCYSGDADAGDKNYADEGWNGMLGENFSPAGDKVIFDGAKVTLTDASWKDHDTDEWKKLAESASNGFAEAVRPYTGVQDDLFCGSGNSGWSDPSKPGEGEFECSNVRFEIANVVPFDKDVQNLNERKAKAEQEKLINEAELKAAKSKYGNRAEFWLGLQDSMKLCTKETNCVITFGDGTSPIVVP